MKFLGLDLFQEDTIDCLYNEQGEKVNIPKKAEIDIQN